MPKECAPEVIYRGGIVPPFSTVVNQLQPTTLGTRIGTVIGGVIMGTLFALFVWWLGHFFAWNWLKYTGVVLAVIFIIGFCKSGWQGQWTFCPYCNGRITGSPFLLLADENSQFDCEHCHEWLISHRGEVRAFLPTDITDQRSFMCPMPKAGVWPSECIVCGAPAVRFLSARSIKFNAASLAIGRISVSDGSIKDIPYCDAHEDAVDAKIVSDKMHAVFDSFLAQRRFLHVNKLFRQQLLAQALARSAQQSPPPPESAA